MRSSPIISTARGTRQEAFGPVEWGLLASIAAMWGSSFLFIAIGLESMRPGLLAFLRLAVGAGTLALFPGTRRPVRREDRPRLLLLGLIWMAIPLLLFPIAQLWITSSLAGMINGSMPLFAAVVAGILLRRAPRLVQTVGLVLGFTGVVLLTWQPTHGGVEGTTLGALLALGATMLYGVSANITVPLQQRYGALPVVFRAQLVALVALLPVGLWSLPGSEASVSGVASVVVLGIGGSGLAFVAMATLVGRAGATRGAVAIYFLPVVATILGVAFRGEHVSVAALVGMALVLGGAYLTSRREG